MINDLKIEKLEISDYEKCGNIWDMKKQKKLAETFEKQLVSGNRVTYICKLKDEFVGEISTVYDMNDSDYTIPNKRIYISRLIVKSEYRRKGIGRKLIDFVTQEIRAKGYSEMSIGVDWDNYSALRLYTDAGFNKIIFFGEDEQGKYFKLLKELN